MAKNFSCFSRRLPLLIFQPSRPLSGNALKNRKAFRTPPAHVPIMPSDDEDALRLQRQIRRAVAETCGPAGIRELPAQDKTAAYVQLLPCGQQFLEARTFFSKTTQRTDIRKMSVRCIGMLWSQSAVEPSTRWSIRLTRWSIRCHNHSQL